LSQYATKEREKMTNIIIVSLDTKMSEVRRFVRVKHMNIFMTKHKLHFALDEEQNNDRRVMYDSKDVARYKVFDFDNDNHHDEKQYKKNKKALPAFFDDLNKVIVESKK
jgi:hypothetical protein